MKVGIVGDAKRAVAWEQHIRPHRIVQEVDLCPHISEIGAVDACLIIDDSDQNLDILLSGIQHELNCFLISKIPTNKEKLQKIHQAANEAGVRVQLSHWPVLAPATQWMMNRVKKPISISINREIAYSQWTSESDFSQYWYDEAGLCLKWVNSGIHRIEAKEVRLNRTEPYFMHLFLRFDNGTSADITINSAAKENRHIRYAFSKDTVLECEVRDQLVRVGQLNSSSKLYFEKQMFDPAKSAEKAVLMFLKSIQMNAETPYSGYDALQLASQVERIKKRLEQFA